MPTQALPVPAKTSTVPPTSSLQAPPIPAKPRLSDEYVATAVDYGPEPKPLNIPLELTRELNSVLQDKLDESGTLGGPQRDIDLSDDGRSSEPIPSTSTSTSMTKDEVSTKFVAALFCHTTFFY